MKRAAERTRSAGAGPALLLAALASALLGCGAARQAQSAALGDGPPERLAQARRRADAQPADLHLQVQAGWMELLIASEPEAALVRFQGVLDAPAAPNEVRALALAGRGEILDDRLQTREAAALYAELLRTAPGSPLAELAAGRLLESEGDSRATDELVLLARSSLRPGAQPRAAWLIRQAAARVSASRAFEAPAPSELEAWASAGTVQHWRVAGAFAAERLLELDRPGPLDGAALARAPSTGPAGSTGERSLDFPDGEVALELEPPEGDLFYAASSLACAQGGDYLLVVEGAGALELRLDGAVALSRSPWPRELPRVQVQPVHLDAGGHALLARWSRAEGPRFRVTLARADGGASDLVSTAPAQLEGRRQAGPCSLGHACAPTPAFVDDGGLRGEAERMRERDPGDPLAAFLLARATLTDDRGAAREAVERLIALSGASASALLLRAVQVLGDPDIPERIGRAKALADLADAAAKEPRLLRARLTLAALQRDAERTDEAADALAQAEEVARTMSGDGQLPARLLVARARLLDAQGNSAQARIALAAARKLDPDRCDANALAAELARRVGTPAEQKELGARLLGCPEQRAALPTQLRDRGDLAGALDLLARLASLRPAQPQRLEQLAELLVARGDLSGAIDKVRTAIALAPRAADPWRHLAGWLDLQGDAAGAQAARQQALARSPGDLSLRHQVALGKGERLLGWSDRDGLAVARVPSPAALLASASDRPSAIRLLDYGGLEFQEDGSALERVHVVARVLDKSGIARFGEVQIPSDAELLQLRTIKPDGRTLEPEPIPEKETHSLPGLEPGDAIEYDYLRAYAPRGPELPGLSLGAFYFADDQIPMVESSYEVRAPAALPLEVEAHHLRVEPIEHRPEGQRFRHAALGVPPEQAEPEQPTEDEVGPWVQVGYGARSFEVARALADWVLLRARPCASIDALAAQAGGRTPREKLEKIFAAVAQAVRGRSNPTDFSLPAQQILALGRGNRLLLLKAALASAGVRAHLALIKPFGALPEPVRFPRGDLFSFVALRVDAQEGQPTPLWIDETWRLGPLGQLPPFARGQPALLLPEPGEPAGPPVRTPDDAGERDDGNERVIRLTLSASGEATGEGRDELRGFEAASLRESLEQLDPQARRHAIEEMLARSVPDVALDTLTFEGEGAQGGPAALVYSFRAQLGQIEPSGLQLPATLLPQHLAARFAEKAERRNPLLLQQLQRSTSRVTLQLPPGLHLQKPAPPVALETPFGSYSWEAKELDGRVQLAETLRVPLQRVSPADYPAFAAFARAVDQVQGQQLSLGR